LNALDIGDTGSSIDYSPAADNAGRMNGMTCEKSLLPMTNDEDRVVTVLEITCLPMEIDDDIAVLLRMCGPFGSVVQAHLLHNNDDTTDDTTNMVVDGSIEGQEHVQTQGGYTMNSQAEFSLRRARVHMRGAKNAKRCAAALDGLVLFEGASPLKVTVLG